MGEAEPTNVTAGIWGFLILFGLAMACWFLYRSMSKHMRNVRMREDRDSGANRKRPPIPLRLPEAAQGDDVQRDRVKNENVKRDGVQSDGDVE